MTRPPSADRLDLDNAAPRTGAAGIFSRNSLAIPHLEALLGVSTIAAFPRRHETEGLAFVVGWGDKASARLPRAFAAATGVPFVAAEDGFLRSVGSHRVKPPPLSLVLDDEGIYYRAATPSRLERLIRAAPGFPAARRAEAAAALARVRGEKLTKYNTLGPAAGGHDEPIRLLLVDQVFGDQSIGGGLASAATFEAMAAAALAAVPAADIAVKVHPDVLAGRARGYLLDIARRHGLALIADQGNPFDLLARVGAVYTVSSQLGFEALLAGRPVTCFGVPFYAGWGATTDVPAGPEAAAALARRGEPRDLQDLFAAAYVAYPRYADPIRNEPISIGAAIDRIVDWRERLAARSRLVAVTLAPPLALDDRLLEAAFGGGGAGVIRAAAGGAGIPAGAEVVTARPARLREDRLARAWGFDGGLMRKTGEAALADILGATPTPAERAEARRLIAALAATAFERTLVVSAAGGDAVSADDRHVAAAVLAAEPSPDDETVIAAARAAHPAATVLALREAPRPRGPTPIDRLKAIATARRGPLAPPPASPLAAVRDHLVGVHVVDSALALDALALGLPVTVHGWPLFAGWGFTTEPAATPRGTRLSFEAFVALAFVRGTEWTDPASGLPALPSEIVERGRRLAAGEPVGPDAGMLETLLRLDKRLTALRKRFRLG